MRAAFFAVVVALVSPAAAKTRIAVSNFRNAAEGQGGCYYHWFGPQLGSGMADQLVTELMTTGRFEIEERANLNQMYNQEHQLINADESAAPAKKKFKAAHYSITGAVTSFEMCASGGGTRANVGKMFGLKKIGLDGLGVGVKTSNAKVGLDVRVVDVETGQVALAFQTEGSARSTGLNVAGAINDAGFGSSAFNKTPLGEATRDALRDAAQRIAKELPEKADAAPAAARAEAEPAEEAPSAPQPRRRGAARAGAGVETEVAGGIVCGIRREAYVQCKPFEASASGKAIKAVNMAMGGELTVAAEQVRVLQALPAAPKTGLKVLVDCKDANWCFTGLKGQFYICRVLDSFSDTVQVQCMNKQYDIPLASLYITAPYDAQQLAER